MHVMVYSDVSDDWFRDGSLNSLRWREALANSDIWDWSPRFDDDVLIVGLPKDDVRFSSFSFDGC